MSPTTTLTDERADRMGTQGSKSLKNFVAITKLYLYDSPKALGLDSRRSGIATVRAVVIVAFLGSIIWYGLWKLAAHFFFAR